MKILVLVHGYPPTAVAGTEICTERLCTALKARGHQLLVMTREELPGYPEYKILEDERNGIPVQRFVNNFTRLRERYLYNFHPRIEEIFEDLLRRFDPDLVHIQHLAGASWGIPEIAKSHRLPLLISLHDYWYACERVQLLRPGDTICPGPDGGRNCTRYCAHGTPCYMAHAAMERVRFATGYSGRFPFENTLPRLLAALQPVTMRRKTSRLRTAYADRTTRLLGALSRADALVSPSDKARSVYTSLGVPAARHVVIPHGLPVPTPVSPKKEETAYDGRRPLMVGYVGNIMPHKGIMTLLRAIKSFHPSRVQCRMYGRSYPVRYARFVKKICARFPAGQITTGGVYQPHELPAILAQLDLLIIPPLWHETFNLVLWEAWAAGLPVIASEVGALADVIQDGTDGFLFPAGDWKALKKTIGNVISDPSLLETVRRNLPRHSLSIEENARRYEELFEGIACKR